MTPFQRKTRILLVCRNNICRSPMAEGLLRHYLKQSELRDRIEVCSAGTKTFQPGCRPDQRAQKVASFRGINLGQIKARRVTQSDLVRSDMIFAMDEPTMRDLRQMSPQKYQEKISYLLSHHSGQPLLEVPDPYFGNNEGFERVFQILDAAMDDLIAYIRTASSEL